MDYATSILCLILLGPALSGAMLIYFSIFK